MGKQTVQPLNYFFDGLCQQYLYKEFSERLIQVVLLLKKKKKTRKIQWERDVVFHVRVTHTDAVFTHFVF